MANCSFCVMCHCYSYRAGFHAIRTCQIVIVLCLSRRCSANALHYAFRTLYTVLNVAVARTHARNIATDASFRGPFVCRNKRSFTRAYITCTRICMPYTRCERRPVSALNVTPFMLLFIYSSILLQKCPQLVRVCNRDFSDLHELFICI